MSDFVLYLNGKPIADVVDASYSFSEPRNPVWVHEPEQGWHPVNVSFSWTLPAPEWQALATRLAAQELCLYRHLSRREKKQEMRLLREAVKRARRARGDHRWAMRQAIGEASR